MKIFSFKRLIGAAVLGGIAYYVKQNGGPKAVFSSLQSKVKDLSSKAKDMMSSGEAASDTGSSRTPSKFSSSDVDRNVERGNAASNYQSYRVSRDDENLH
ncbi:MAG TPA: hypothetical protein VGM39_26225 [Kofleriaceae bacterium]|jgi:hypothetical protein